MNRTLKNVAVAALIFGLCASSTACHSGDEANIAGSQKEDFETIELEYTAALTGDETKPCHIVFYQPTGGGGWQEAKPGRLLVYGFSENQRNFGDTIPIPSYVFVLGAIFSAVALSASHSGDIVTPYYTTSPRPWCHSEEMMKPFKRKPLRKKSGHPPCSKNESYLPGRPGDGLQKPVAGPKDSGI